MSVTSLNINSTIKDGISAIENSNKRIAVMLNEKGQLLGTLTDGDIRRFLLKGIEKLSNDVNDCKMIKALVKIG